MERSKTEMLRCYVCGEPLGQFITLMFYGEDIDRVFLAHDECSESTDATRVKVETRDGEEVPT